LPVVGLVVPAGGLAGWPGGLREQALDVRRERGVGEDEARVVEELVERLLERGRRRVALVAVHLEGAIDDGLEGERHLGVALGHRGVLAGAHALDGADLVVGPERVVAGQHLVQHHADAEQVRALVEVLGAFRLLGATCSRTGPSRCRRRSPSP
jgi:hypothetical protein